MKSWNDAKNHDSGEISANKLPGGFRLNQLMGSIFENCFCNYKRPKNESHKPA